MKKNWYWLIPIVVAFIVGYLLRGVGPVQLLQKAPVGYDIFYDLLSIFLALLVGAGTLLYLVIRREVREHVRDDITKEFSKIRTKLDSDAGLLYYYQGLYEEAIEETKRALSQEENLEEIDKIWAKNNLAYYYAAKHTGYRPSKERYFKKHEQWENKDEAIRLAKFVYDKYDPFVREFNRPDWVETYAFVTARFARTPTEKREAKKLIKALLLRKHLQARKEALERSLRFLSH